MYCPIPVLYFNSRVVISPSISEFSTYGISVYLTIQNPSRYILTKHALELDAKNGNTLWRDAIMTELKQLDDFQVFRTIDTDETLEGYQKLPCHVVFDVKFDLRRKARLVVGGDHQTGPKDESYSGVVSLTTIRILFLLATINKLHLWAADIENAFLNGITRDKLYIVAGPEFGPERAGKVLVLYESIYGARSSCAIFHKNLSEKLLTNHPKQMQTCGTKTWEHTMST